MRTAGRLLIVGLLAAPLLMPLAELASTSAWTAGAEATRVSALLRNTLLFTVATLALTLPVGLGLAVVLFRLCVPLSSLARFALLLGVFVPLPVYACAWQPALGYDWPWGKGIPFAAVVHALAALPGVVWVIGLGLNHVPRELEDDARTVLPPWGVFCRVTLPAVRAHLMAAAAWVVLQTTGEITVTDMAEVRTFAEEIYTQFVTNINGLGRAVAVSLPVNLLLLGVFAWVTRRVRPSARAFVFRPPTTGAAGPWQIPLTGLVAAFLIVWAGIPLVNLLRQAAGHRGDTPGSFTTLGRELFRGATLNADLLGQSLLESAGVAVICVGLAVVMWELVKQSPRQRRIAGLLLGALAVTPGPVIGFGLLRVIVRLMDAEDVLLGPLTAERPVRFLLYDGPSPLPVMAAHGLRFLPYAALILWPLLSHIPKPLLETARQEGATSWGVFRHVTWPCIRGGAFAVGIMVTAFALGEISAGKIVQIPGRRTFAQELLNQMHYGVTSTVAALALVQLGTVAGLVAVGWLANDRMTEAPARKASQKR